MALTFRSSTPETFRIIGQDSDGGTRVAEATKVPGQTSRWDLRLTHQSGRNWQATFHGPNVLDALGELMNSKNSEFLQEKARGHRPEPQPYDHNRQLPETGDFSPIVPINRR